MCKKARCKQDGWVLKRTGMHDSGKRMKEKKKEKAYNQHENKIMRAKKGHSSPKPRLGKERV